MKLNTTVLIFLCTMALVTLGVVMVTSTSAAIAARELNKQQVEQNAGGVSSERPKITSHSYFYTKRQFVWAIVSVAAMLIVYRIDYDKYKKFATPMLVGSFVLLLLVFVPGIGLERNGAHRWIRLGPAQLQASEVAKLALIIYLAKKLCDHNQVLKSFLKGFLPLVFVLSCFLVAIVVEPDLGAAVVIALIAFTMFAVAGMRMVHLCTLGVVMLPFVGLAIWLYPYRIKRLVAFLDPTADIHGKGWQLYQSLISVGSGGVEGLGLGMGPQKYLFLSEAYTDFIYAGICEELGMVGALGVIAIYVLFMFQGYRVAMKLQDMYGSLLATGITAMIGIQAFINMFVVLGLVPTKGLTLPLVSYGGSSLLINMVAIGILMNLSKEAELVSTPLRRQVLRHARA